MKLVLYWWWTYAELFDSDNAIETTWYCLDDSPKVSLKFTGLRDVSANLESQHNSL